LTNEALFRSERGLWAGLGMPDFPGADWRRGLTIPLPGFGKKSAAILIGTYEKLERIPANPQDWKVKPRGAIQLAATLAEHRDDSLLYRQLATLVDTVPLDDSLDDLQFRGVPRERVSTGGATARCGKIEDCA